MQFHTKQMSEKVFIFDLDGVIVDTAKYHYLAWKQLANNLGFDFTKEQNELLKGVSRVDSLEILLRIGKVELDNEHKKNLLEEKNNQYLKFIAQIGEEEILPRIKNLLIYLKDKNIPLALGSASKNAKLILRALCLYEFFDIIIDGNDVSTAKPNPEVFLKAAKKLNKNPRDCVVIEDAIAGVKAAKNAKMFCVGIGDEKILNEADFVLNDTNGLTIDFIEKLMENKN